MLNRNLEQVSTQTRPVATFLLKISRKNLHDATCNTPEHRTESSSEQCSTTTCKTQQSANATSQQNLHSAGDCVEELKLGPNVSPDDIADIPLLNRLVVPSAKCKLFWTNSDQALDAVLEKECPNFAQPIGPFAFIL